MFHLGEHNNLEIVLQDTFSQVLWDVLVYKE